MAGVFATIVLPHLFRLPDGPFGSLYCRHRAPAGVGTREGLTAVSLRFEVSEPVTEEQQETLKARHAQRLLRETNRLLRWYRAVSGQTEIVELTRVEASPFEFTIEETGAAWGGDPIFYAQEVFSGIPKSMGEIASEVRTGLDAGGEPDVQRKVICPAGALEEFPGGSRLSNKCLLLTGRALTRQPWWDELAASYAKRNAIIHAGEGADEADAERAIDVARQVVAMMRAPDLTLLSHAT